MRAIASSKAPGDSRPRVRYSSAYPRIVATGVIETEMSQQVRDLADDQIKARILLRRYGQASDVAHAVWFLASRFADYITGEVLHVDGGFKME